MQDEKGNTLTEKEIIKTALDHLSEACCFLFECESAEAQAAAFMADMALKYTNVIYNGDCPLEAACDFTAYEQSVALRKCEMKDKIKARLTVINSELGVS